MSHWALNHGPMSASVPTALPAHAAAVVVNSTTPLWYVTRATGLVAMVLLTIAMACGLLSAVGYQRPRLPRFVTLGLHRNASLLALAFTVVHVVTTVTDSYAHIPVQDAVIPFISAYRPLWLGLGAVAFDLMLALTVTSLLRSRMSYRSWLAVHWTAYACWPVALLHGLGTGSDASVRWVLLLTLLCVAVVAALAGWRLAFGWPGRPVARVAGAVVLLLALIAGGAWLSAGPLKPGWARRAGTPPALLHHAAGPLVPGTARETAPVGSEGARAGAAGPRDA
jgi:sulfoxide reductase heme-binding subunit YedZ